MDTLKHAINLRAERKNNQKIKDTIIRDLRVYYNSLPSKALYPYDYQFTEIFLNILKSKNLKCPHYDHLYIQVGKTIEDCLIHSIPYDNRYENGIAVIDYDEYQQQNEMGKQNIVFEIISAGLKDIATIDELDIGMINNTIDEIKLNALNTELVHMTAENENYRVLITYFSRSMEDGNPVYLNIVEKSTGRSGKIQIGKAGKDQLYFWVSKLSLNSNQVKIKARKSSVKTDLYLKDKTRDMEFNIKELING